MYHLKELIKNIRLLIKVFLLKIKLHYKLSVQRSKYIRFKGLFCCQMILYTTERFNRLKTKVNALKIKV